jgi:hypothetical protein
MALIALNIASCATAGANNNQQEQVKNAVLKALEQEYKQPFKILDFNYKYESHSNPHDCVFLYCKTEKYGTYYFKIQAVNNLIIIIDFKMNDGGTEKSIKPLIDFFKKNQLNRAYCDGLESYYDKIKITEKLEEPYTKQAEEYCNNRGQKGYELYKKYYVEHQTK